MCKVKLDISALRLSSMRSVIYGDEKGKPLAIKGLKLKNPLAVPIEIVFSDGFVIVSEQKPYIIKS